MATLADRNLKRAESQERVLAHLGTGCTIREALARVGLTEITYFRWKKASPSFKKQAEAIMARRRFGSSQKEDEETGDVIDTHTLAGFRKHYFKFDTYAHQQKMIDAIENAPPGSTTMILMPPEWMKTTTIEDYICKTLAFNPNMRICDISEGRGHAEKTLGRVKRRMTDRSMCEDYIDDFGPFKAPERQMQKPWSIEHITVLRADHDERDFSLECRGVGSSIYGARYDLVILDDVQSRKSIGSTERLVDLFRQDWRTRPGKAGKLIIIGTRVGKGDFYEEVLKLGLINELVRIPAFDDQGRSNFPAVFDEDGDRVTNSSGDPIGWTEEELHKREFEVGPEIWDRVYMQLGRSAKSGSFPQSVIDRALDYDRGFGSVLPGKAAHKGLGRLSAIDPALGGYCGFVSCSYDANFLYVEGLRNEPGLNRTEEIFAIVEQETIEHLPECWVWERNNLQHGMARDDRLMELRDKYSFYVVEHFTGQTKLDDKIGIPSMASAMNRGEIRLPWAPECRDLVGQLTEELLDWRVDVPAKLLRQDLVIALWECYLRWQAVRESLQTDFDAFNRTGAPSFTAYQTMIGTWR